MHGVRSKRKSLPAIQKTLRDLRRQDLDGKHETSTQPTRAVERSPSSGEPDSRNSGALLPEELGPQCKIATPQQLSELLAALMRAGQCLHAATGCSDIDLQKETQSYRKEVERLQTVLPSIQAALVAERERLQEQRNRVSTTAAWAQASRETIQR